MTKRLAVMVILAALVMAVVAPVARAEWGNIGGIGTGMVADTK